MVVFRNRESDLQKKWSDKNDLINVNKDQYYLSSQTKEDSFAQKTDVFGWLMDVKPKDAQKYMIAKELSNPKDIFKMCSNITSLNDKKQENNSKIGLIGLWRKCHFFS